MAMKPILFNTEMLQAIIDGRKTQTRRIVNGLDGVHPYRAEPAEGAYETLDEWDFIFGGMLPNGGFYDACQAVKAPCAIGDILWVRETWAHGYIEHSDAEGNRESWFEPSPIGCDGYIGALSRFFYRADEKDYGEVGIKWCPSRHMPKQAARIFLKVKDIRAERLQDMDEEDAIAEGFPDSPTGTDSLLWRFSELWDKTVKHEDLRQFGYHANPWVWVIEFERCEKPKNWLQPIDKISKKEYTIDVGGGIDCLK